jgi:hypothetical protein
LKEDFTQGQREAFGWFPCELGSLIEVSGFFLEDPETRIPIETVDMSFQSASEFNDSAPEPFSPPIALSKLGLSSKFLEFSTRS